MKIINEKTQSARRLYDEEADVLHVSANDPKPVQSVDVEESSPRGGEPYSRKAAG